MIWVGGPGEVTEEILTNGRERKDDRQKHTNITVTRLTTLNAGNRNWNTVAADFAGALGIRE